MLQACVRLSSSVCRRRLWRYVLWLNGAIYRSYQGHDFTLIISETIRDRGLVTMEHQYEMAYGLSNGHVTDDVTWPWKVKTRDPNTLRAQYLENYMSYRLQIW